MRYGLTEQTIQQINSVFEKHPVVKQAVLYGSRAKGNYKPGSDIDLSLFGEDISQSEMNQILDELDALDLPYTIDLTVFRDINHAKFRDHIARVGVVFYQRDEDTPSEKFAKNYVRDYSAECRVHELGCGDVLQLKKSSWKYFRLGDVCKTGAGGTPLKSIKEYYDGGDIPWLLSGEVSQGEIHKSNNFITKKGLEGSSAKIFPKNTVLVAMYGATAGQVGILKIEAATNQAVCGILPDKKFVPEFLYYTMLHKQAELIATATGNAQPNVSQVKIKNLQIPLLAIDEQKRLVSILDEAFERIDAAIANTEKNIANARELFESYLDRVFLNDEPGWVLTKLGEVCKFKHGFMFKSEYFCKDGEYVLLTPGSFYESGGFRDQGSKTKYYDGPIPNGYILSKGDFLVAMTEQAVGLLGSALVVPESNKYLHNQRLGLVKPTGKFDWSNDFFLHLFKTKYFRSAVQSTASGVKVRHTSPSKLEDIFVKIPLKKHAQLSVADELNELEMASFNITSTYRAKLSLLRELKQSLLQKAFSGELPTDFNLDALEH